MVKLGSCDGPLLQVAAIRMGCFLREKNPDGTVVTSMEAVTVIMKRLGDIRSKNLPITLDMCRDVQIFRYLLSDADCKLVDSWTEKHLARPLAEDSGASNKPNAKHHKSSSCKTEQTKQMSGYYFKLDNA